MNQIIQAFELFAERNDHCPTISIDFYSIKENDEKNDTKKVSSQVQELILQRKREKIKLKKDCFPVIECN